jgi:transposase, IS5 family
MGYKKMDQALGFADFALPSSLKHDRSLKTTEQLDKAINGTRIDEILIAPYTVGTSGEVADAYPPLFLTKSLLL